MGWEYTKLLGKSYTYTMLYHQFQMLESSGTAELTTVAIKQFLHSYSLLVKLRTFFLASSPKEGMFKHANISLALDLLGMFNSRLKELL